MCSALNLIKTIFLNTKVTFVLFQALFSPFEIDEVEELSLGANFKLSEVHRLQWRSTQGTVTPEDIGTIIIICIA